MSLEEKEKKMATTVKGERAEGWLSMRERRKRKKKEKKENELKNDIFEFIVCHVIVQKIR